jgi:type II secretory pathway pseudopilin PulG
MGWILLEALLALGVGVAIVAWTIAPSWRKSRRERTDDTGPGGKR